MRLVSGVFRAHRHGPHVAVAILIGVAFGIAQQLYYPVGYFLSSRFSPLFDLHPLLCVPGAVAVIVLIRRDCPHRQWRIANGLCAAAGAVTAMMLFNPFNQGPRWTPGQLWLELAAAWFLGGSFGGVLALVLWWVRDLAFGAPMIAETPICPQCGYDVRGLPNPRCPECGRKLSFEDSSALPPPAWRAWRPTVVRTGAVLFSLLVVFAIYPRLLIPAMMSGAVDYEAANYYVGLRPVTAAKLFSSYLNDGSAPKRAEAASALMWFRSWPPGTREALVQLALNDPDPLVRAFSIQTLGFVNIETLKPLMDALLKDPVAGNRRTALASISRYGPEEPPPPDWAVAYLIDLLDDPDAKTREYVHQRLREVTRQRFPFAPAADCELRLAQQAVWRQWWNERVAGSGDEADSSIQDVQPDAPDDRP